MENKQKNNLCDTNSCMDIKVLEEKHEKKKLKLHFIYVSIILVALLIAVVVINKTLTGSILAHIATVTSIILSVLAIFITVLANDSTNNLLHRIRDIADNLGKLPKHIAENIKKLDDSTAKLDKIDNLDKITQLDQLTKLDALQKLDRLQELEKLKDLTAIIEKLQKIEEGVGRQADELSIIKEGMGNNMLKGTNSIPNGIIDENNLLASDESVRLYLAASSQFGLLLIYALYMCYSHKKKFNLDVFNKAVLSGSNIDGEHMKYYHYLYGYLICLSAIPGYIDLPTDKDHDFEIISLHPYIKRNISLNDRFGRFKTLVDKFVEESPSIDDSSNEEEKQ